jgi:hypothetical protein
MLLISKAGRIVANATPAYLSPSRRKSARRFREPCTTRGISTPSRRGRYSRSIFSKPDTRKTLKEARAACLSRGCHPICGCVASRPNVYGHRGGIGDRLRSLLQSQGSKLGHRDPGPPSDERRSEDSPSVALLQAFIELAMFRFPIR